MASCITTPLDLGVLLPRFLGTSIDLHSGENREFAEGAFSLSVSVEQDGIGVVVIFFGGCSRIGKTKFG
ncbi:MAG TPA: hypothetical protein HPQ00_16740 [Magnetococcales bacterium]|nr:hypothetical protein [Magnetococcales bacterium]